RAEPIVAEAGEPRGHPLARFEPLVRTEPPNLGYQPLQVGNLAFGWLVPPWRFGGRPRGDHHRLTAGEGGPQSLGDERHERVQLSEQVIEDVPQHSPRRFGHLTDAGKRRLDQLDVPVADLVPREVEQRVARLGKLEVFEVVVYVAE